MAGRQRVRDLLDERRLILGVRDHLPDLVVVGDVEREVDERTNALEVVVEGPRRARPQPSRRAFAPSRRHGRRYSLSRPRRACAATWSAKTLDAPPLDRPAAVLADRLRALGKRRDGTPRPRRAPRSISSRTSSGWTIGACSVSTRAAAGSGRSCRGGRAPGSRAASPIRCATTRIVSFPTSGTSTSGRSSSNEPLERAEVADGAPDRPLLRPAGVDAGRRSRRRGCAGSGRSPRSGAPRSRGRRARRRARPSTSSRQRASSPRSRSRRAAARETLTCAVSCPRRSSSAPTRAVELALVGLERREEEAHRQARSTASERIREQEAKAVGECSRTTYSRPAARIRARVAASSSSSATVSASSSGLEAREHAAAARVAHELLRPARRRRHDRDAAGERLGRDDPEPLLPRGQDEERRLAQRVGDRIDRPSASTPSGTRGGRAADQAQPRVRDARADQRQRLEQERQVLARIVGAADEDERRRLEPARARSRPARAREPRCRRGSAGSRSRPRHAPRQPRSLPATQELSRVDARRLADHAPLEPSQDEARSRAARAGARDRARARAAPTRRRASSRASSRRPPAAGGAASPCVASGRGDPERASPRARRGEATSPSELPDRLDPVERPPPAVEGRSAGEKSSSGARPSARAPREERVDLGARPPPPKRGSGPRTARSVTPIARR